jgi:hypothetical protein
MSLLWSHCLSLSLGLDFGFGFGRVPNPKVGTLSLSLEIIVYATTYNVCSRLRRCDHSFTLFITHFNSHTKTPSDKKKKVKSVIICFC